MHLAILYTVYLSNSSTKNYDRRQARRETMYKYIVAIEV